MTRPQYGLLYRHVVCPIHIRHTVDLSMDSLPCHDIPGSTPRSYNQFRNQLCLTSKLKQHLVHGMDNTMNHSLDHHMNLQQGLTTNIVTRHVSDLNIPDHNITTIMANGLNSKTQMSHHILTCMQSYHNLHVSDILTISTMALRLSHQWSKSSHMKVT